MHKSSIIRMQWFVEQYLTKTNKNERIKVLDVGSYDVNGSYKHLFPEDSFEYYGLDMEKGPNVDIVMETPYIWSNIETDFFDVVISGQAFEHIEFFWITMGEMARVLKKEGLICIIAPNGFYQHRYPVDCYRFFTDGMISIARYVCLDVLHAHTNLAPSVHHIEWYSEEYADSMLIAQKNYSGVTKYVDLKTYKCIPANHEIVTSPLVALPIKKKKLKKRNSFFHRVIDKINILIGK